MTVRVLTDFHHHALAESLLMLMEDRYGWEVYFPTGMEWYDDDIWVFEREFHGDAVARQFLVGIWDTASKGKSEARPWYNDGTTALANAVPIVLRDDPRHKGRFQKGVTLPAARMMKWDILLSSLPHNDTGMAGFAKERGALFGVQVGNHLQYSRWDLADFVLSSSTLAGFGPEYIGQRFTFQGCPTVMYHQEFSLQTFRHEYPPAHPREVASWVNGFPESPDYPLFLGLAREYAAEFDFKVYGAYGWGADDEFKAGDVSDVAEIGDKMRAARVGLQVKRFSDGFGHTIHNWFAIGRPVLGFMDYYKDKIASALFLEGVTSFSLDGRNTHEIADIIRKLIEDDDYHQRISENAARRFREVVDFDHEAEVIKEMLEGLLP
jgi:hypothetical protein